MGVACRYKALYRPSDLLCRATLSWVRITPELLAALDADCNRHNLSTACDGAREGGDAQRASVATSVIDERSSDCAGSAGACSAEATDAGATGLPDDAVRIGLHGRVLTIGELREHFGPRIGGQAAAICSEFLDEVGARFAADSVLVLC